MVMDAIRLPKNSGMVGNSIISGKKIIIDDVYKDEAELLKQASPMHDIEEIAMSDTILNKPDRLNDEERTIMDKGMPMVKDLKKPLLRAASIVACEHHEKYNGQGYPNKTKGEDIYIYGRITALADIWIIKKLGDDEKIFKLLKEEKCEYFNPRLIDLFLENLDEILFTK